MRRRSAVPVRSSPEGASSKTTLSGPASASSAAGSSAAAAPLATAEAAIDSHVPATTAANAKDRRLIKKPFVPVPGSS
jgi:hypothetical protein